MQSALEFNPALRDCWQNTRYWLNICVGRPLIIPCFVGDEVTSLKFLRFLKGELETPYVVSYSISRLLKAQLQAHSQGARTRKLIVKIERV